MAPTTDRVDRERAESRRVAGRWSARYREILDVAAEIFAQKGYAATSMQDIAAAAGVLKGSLYHHINSKEDLLLDVMGDFHEDLVNLADHIHDTEPDPVAALRRTIEAHVGYNAAHRVRAGVCYNEFRSLSEHNWERLLAIRDRYERGIRQLVADAQRSGAVRADIDPHVAAFVILGSVNTLHHWYRESGPLTPDEVGRQYAAVLLQGILTAPS